MVCGEVVHIEYSYDHGFHHHLKTGSRDCKVALWSPLIDAVRSLVVHSSDFQPLMVASCPIG